jgi:putative membrane protein
MKKTSNFKKTVLFVAFVTSIFIMVSCGHNQKAKDARDVAEELSIAKSDKNEQEKDAQFLVNAAGINLEQIQLGQLAQQKGETRHVKELGKIMEDTHTKSLSDLRVLAKSKMITIPNSPTNYAMEVYKKLNEESGNEFDIAYADMMVSGHKDAIKAFEDASIYSYNTDIKKWATATLPELRINLTKYPPLL